MKTLYETKDGRVSDSDYQAFVDKVKQSYTPTDQIHYYHLEIEGDKRILRFAGLICLDEKCGCGGW